MTCENCNIKRGGKKLKAYPQVQLAHIWTESWQYQGGVDINGDRYVVKLISEGPLILAGPLVNTSTSCPLKIKSKPYSTVCLSCSVSLSALFMSQ